MAKGSRIQLRRAKTIHGKNHLPRYHGPIHDNWIRAARLKGFVIVDRVIDKDHLLLECSVCNLRHAKRHSVVRSAKNLLCPHCQEARLRTLASQAGLSFLRRDPVERGYAYLLAPCGHEVRRQFSSQKRARKDGCGIRCDICHAAREADEALEQGWELIGPDPNGDVSYRLYRHAGGCGHKQRLARGNMQTGRIQCEACGECWSAMPSQIYVMEFQVPKLGTLTKAGYSKNPTIRLRNQLRPAPEVSSRIVRTLPMVTGRAARQFEQALHHQIKRKYPGAAVPKDLLRDWIRVGSEIYRPIVNAYVHERLDAIDVKGVG